MPPPPPPAPGPDRTDPPEAIDRFSDRAEDYARHRPGYPRGVVGVLEDLVGLTPAWVVADVGSGTGLSTRLFLDYGNTVFAVEPNAAMRAAAEAALGARPGFRSVAGTAESTTLPAGSVDLVVAAQAFHWFRADAAAAELGRILRGEGWAALIWNTRRTEATPFLRSYEALLLRHGTDYDRVRHDRLDPARIRGFFSGDVRREVLPNEQRLDLAGLKGRLLSSSYTPPAGDPRREPMLRDLEALFGDHAEQGTVCVTYDTELYVGRVGRPG